MKFYLFPPSPNVRKVNAVISHLEIGGIERQLVNMMRGEHKAPEFLSINPMGKLPALATDSGMLLWESNAICQFLCDREGDTAFYPQDARVRADIARWLFWDASAWSRATEVLTHENVRKPMMGIGDPDPAMVKEGEALFKPLAKILDDHFSKQPFLVGDAVTLADFVVGGSATYMERGNFPIADFPHLQVWWTRLNQVPAWQASIPSAELPA